MDSSSTRGQVHRHHLVRVRLSGFDCALAAGWAVSRAGAPWPAPPAASNCAEVIPLPSGPTGTMPCPTPVSP